MYDIDERETVAITSDVDDCWEIYTRQRKIMNVLNKRGYEPFKVEMDGDRVVAAEYMIPFNRISFRSAEQKKIELTDEQRAERARKLKEARENKNK